VAAIACHGDNGVWVGTDGGLVRLKVPRVTVYTKRDGLANDFVGNECAPAIIAKKTAASPRRCRLT
jgi:hypothetical protein